MSHPLAIFTKEFGVATQTFVRRHIVDLLPGRTVVVCDTIHPSYDGTMDGECPVLVLGHVRRGLLERGKGFIARRIGWSSPDQKVDALRRFLRAHDVEVVMGEHLDHSLPWLETAQTLGIRFFPHGHGHDVTGRLRNARVRADYLRYNHADGVITISRANRERLIGIGLRPEKVHVIPCSVEVPAEPRRRTSTDRIRVLAVGRMVEKKAPITALDAFRRASETRPALTLDFVGDGPLLPAAQEFVRCFRLESKVTLHGAAPHADVIQLMNDADIFIQHSIVAANGDEEGLPVAVLEAMAAALPVVSTRHAGIPEAVQEKITGLLVEEGDNGSMAACIVDLARDHDLRLAMGHAGWRRASECFSWQKEQQQLRALLGLNAYV